MSRQGCIHSFWDICYTTASTGSCFTLFGRKHFFQARNIGDKWKNPSQKEECAETLLGYEKERTYPTVVKFLIFQNHCVHFSQEPESLYDHFYICCAQCAISLFITYKKDCFLLSLFFRFTLAFFKHYFIASSYLKYFHSGHLPGI